MNKPDFGLSFWSLYTLGFTVVLPAVLYYTTGDMEAPPQESAVTAFIYLGLGIVLWLVAILLYTRFFITIVFTDKRRLEKTAEEGKTIVARITDKKQTGVLHDTVTLDLRLAFDNLVGTAVEIPYQLNDGKPYERRFETGNTIEMRASLDEKNAVLVPGNMQAVRNKGVIALWSVVYLLVLMAAIVYPIFSYQLESQGSGWRFLKFTHPWILVPVINLGLGALIWLLFRFIGNVSGDSGQPLRMILYGKKTMGAILNYNLTGTYINEQPQVQFDVEYTDQQGLKHLVHYRKIVSLLEIHRIATGPREIMYLPAQPQNIVFYEDLTL